MSRFFVPISGINDETIILGRENANHLTVLRHRIGDEVTVCDGLGMDYLCKIDSLSKKNAVLSILHKKFCDFEPNFKISLFQALPKSDKMELIIQKCVELGVFEIIPVETQNTVMRLKDNSKIERYRKISESAAKQAGRGIIPHVSNCISFDEAVSLLSQKDTKLIAYENADINAKFSLININSSEIGIFIGPEGGFADEEVKKCAENGIKPISLGKRILRTETAAMVAIFTISYSKEC